ncbi:hypothetical protein FB451DRAFT_1373542 [Mycena latifolia]|nr:hypothetical protein FB451DRAFT_1373542 [Mycena latifolia]
MHLASEPIIVHMITWQTTGNIEGSATASEMKPSGGGDKTGVCLSGASNVLAANNKSKTCVPCLFGGDESRCFNKARRSFNNRKRIDLIVNNECNDVYGPEQTTSTVFNRVYGRFGACKPFRTQWEQTQRTV